ncbi:unnamed protein product, partial [Hapterophycus canaliculatus]
GSEEEESPEVSTRRIRCRRVLVTVGLGVLKDGTALAFSPPLPSAKLSAIQRLGFGTTDKIFFRCTKKGGAGSGRAGPDPSLRIGIVRPAAEEQQQQQQQRGRQDGQQQPLRWVDDIFSFDAEGDYVYSWLTGPSARAAEETERAGEVTDTLLSLLRTVTGDPSWEKPSDEELETLNGVRGASTRPLPALVRSDWNSNPLFRGSYSYVATGSSPQDMEELARPLSSVEGASGRGSSAGTDADADGFGRHLGAEAERQGGAQDDVSRHGRERGDRGGGSGSSARVFFAGEAMHPQFFSTAHGGFESGRRAAREVLASCGLQDAAAALVREKKAE